MSAEGATETGQEEITWEWGKARGPIKQRQSNVALAHCVRKKVIKKSMSASKREAEILHWGNFTCADFPLLKVAKSKTKHVFPKLTSTVT